MVLLYFSDLYLFILYFLLFSHFSFFLYYWTHWSGGPGLVEPDRFGPTEPVRTVSLTRSLPLSLLSRELLRLGVAVAAALLP